MQNEKICQELNVFSLDFRLQLAAYCCYGILKRFQSAIAIPKWVFDSEYYIGVFFLVW